MSKESIFNELITEMAKDGEVSSSAYEILLEKGKDLGFDKNTVDLLIKLELAESSERSFDDEKGNDVTEQIEDGEHIFKSAITRGGSVLTPDVIIVNDNAVTYKKRNKYLINVDSISILISKISSVELDSSLWGTDIIIKSVGAGEIIGKKFTKSDAKEIKRLIQERQNK
ncbi:MAG: hypothetical protein A2033_09765 [Bacteroidetes bacterium GWA2_31_9]|nr:MAG: hypothetical protein A2033_09765 [Bacteroidetes bacterium GWA2_31_9]